MPQYKDETGKTISLGTEIAQGGEGTVYPVKNSNLVAKVYKDKYRNSSRIEKVKTMCHLADENLSKFSAWPQKILFENEKPVGFLMDKIAGFEEVHNLYGTSSRKKIFPNADYGFLIHTAKNLAAAIQILHSKGIVVGDINQNNILVDKRAMVKLLDCDSFQVISNGNNFLCEVGVPEYTSPELQGTSFHNVVRTQNHDNFGLAVIIFQILMLGNHPYSGIGAPPERNVAIAQDYYCGGNKADMTPLTKIIFKSLNSDIKDMFENAFCTNSQRPTPREWYDALDLQEKSLQKCLFNHLYSGNRCIWCDLASKGLVLFENNSDNTKQTKKENNQKKQEQQNTAAKKKQTEQQLTPKEKRDVIQKIEYWLFKSPTDDTKALKCAENLIKKHNITEADLGYDYKFTQRYQNANKNNKNTTTKNINSSANKKNNQTKIQVIDTIKSDLRNNQTKNIKVIFDLISQYDIKIDELEKKNVISYLKSSLKQFNNTNLSAKEILESAQNIILQYYLSPADLGFDIKDTYIYQNVHGTMSDFAKEDDENDDSVYTVNKSKITPKEQIRINIRELLSDVNKEYKKNGTVNCKKIDEVLDLMSKNNISEQEIDWFQIYSKKNTDNYSYKNTSKNQTKNKFDNTSNERYKAVNRVIELLNLKNTASISFIYSLIIKYDIQINEIGKDNLIWYLWSALDCPNKSSLSDKEVVDYAQKIINKYNLQPIDLHFDIKNLRLYKNVQNNTPDKNQEAQAYSKAAAILRVKKLVSKLVVEDGEICQESYDALDEAENLIKEFNITSSDLGFNYKKTLLYERIRGKDISVQSEESNYQNVINKNTDYKSVNNSPIKAENNKENNISRRAAIIDGFKSLLTSRDKTVCPISYLKKIKDLTQQHDIKLGEIRKSELIDYLSYALNSKNTTSLSDKKVLEIAQYLIMRYNITPTNCGFNIKDTAIYKKANKNIVNMVLESTHKTKSKSFDFDFNIFKYIFKVISYLALGALVLGATFFITMIIIKILPIIFLLFLFGLNGLLGGGKKR